MGIQKRKNKHGATYRVEVYNKSKRVAYATFDSLSLARSYEADIRSQLDKGIYIDRSAAEDMTLSDALDKYNDTESRGKKNAYVREVSQARQIKKYPIALLPLASIKSADVAAFRDARSAHVGLNSVRLALAMISDLFSVAIKEWHMDYLSNPVLTITKPSVSSTQRDRRLLVGEYDWLIEGAVGYGGNMQYIIPFAIATAMRQSEIANIRFCDINFDSRVVLLHDTKNNEDRTVPLSTVAFDIISIVSNANTDPIFGMSGPAISKAFTRICKRIEPEPILNLHFHDLRHEATSTLFELGLSTEQVKAITGHKTYSMLARYTHLKAADLVKLLK